MKTTKCHSFLFSQSHHDSQPTIQLHCQPLSYGSTPSHTYLLLLCIRFDGRMTFKYHLSSLHQKAGLHLHQLSCISNSIYGLDQANLITMYISYIQSVLEYAAPVWYPCMCQTNVRKVQVLQNTGLQIALGVPRST
jgi:hypothetical protein